MRRDDRSSQKKKQKNGPCGQLLHHYLASPYEYLPTAGYSDAQTHGHPDGRIPNKFRGFNSQCRLSHVAFWERGGSGGGDGSGGLSCSVTVYSRLPIIFFAVSRCVDGELQSRLSNKRNVLSKYGTSLCFTQNCPAVAKRRVKLTFSHNNRQLEVGCRSKPNN